MLSFWREQNPFADHNKRNKARFKHGTGNSKVKGFRQGETLYAGSDTSSPKPWNKREAVAAIKAGPEAWDAYRSAHAEPETFLDLTDLDFNAEFGDMPKMQIGEFEYLLHTPDEELEKAGVKRAEMVSFDWFDDLLDDPKTAVKVASFQALSGYDFSWVDFGGCKFEKFALWQCRLNDANFYGATIFKSIIDAPEIAKGVWFDHARIQSSYISVPTEGADFFDTILNRVEFSGSFDGATFVGARFESGITFPALGFVLLNVEMTEQDDGPEVPIGCAFYDCVAAPDDGGSMKCMGLEHARIDECHFPGLRIRGEVSNVEITRSFFRGADFTHCMFKNTVFSYTSISKVDFSYSEFTNTRFVKVNYKRRELDGLFRGIHDSSGIRGDLVSQQDLRDQVFIDSLDVDLDETERERTRRLSHGDEDKGSNRARLGLSIKEAVEKYIDLRSALLSGLLGGLLGLFISHYDGGIIWVPLLATMFAFSGGFLNTPTGQRQVVLRIWRQLDYGRDWDRVLVGAGIVVALMGGLYLIMAPEHLCFVPAEGVPANMSCDPDVTASETTFGFYAWYVAIMGFATLGLTDVVEIRSALGAVLVTLNVLAGFITLGLLLAVISRSFTRSG